MWKTLFEIVVIVERDISVGGQFTQFCCDEINDTKIKESLLCGTHHWCSGQGAAL